MDLLSSCHSNLSNGKLPDCSKANNEIPCETTLFKLDIFRRKINFSRYSIYANIHELPRDGQLSIHANVVNIPADVNSAISTSPRSIDESQTSPIN